jgi:hypothetical protein
MRVFVAANWPRSGGRRAMGAQTATDAGHAIWSFCPTCWGQRRIWEDRNGEGLVPSVCPACLGLGDRLAGGR